MAYLKELGFTGIDDSGSKGGGTIFLPSVYSSDGGLKDVTFEDLAANYKYLQDAMNAVRDKFGSENPVFEVLADAYNEYDAALSDAIDQIDKNNQMIAEDAFLAAQKLAKPENLDQFEKMRKDLIQQVQNDLSFDENGTYSAEELVDKTLGTNDYYAGLLEELNQRESQAKQVNEKMQAIAEALVPKNYEQYEPGTSAHFHELDAWLAEADEVKEKLRGLSDEEFEVAYDAVINQGATTWDDITAAIEKYNSEQEVARRHSEQLKTTIKSLWNSENFADAKEELMTLSTTLDGITAENVKELAEESGILAGVLDEDGMNAQFLAHILQVMAEGGDGVALITEQALKLNDALDGMVDKFDSVTDAKAR